METVEGWLQNGTAGGRVRKQQQADENPSPMHWRPQCITGPAAARPPGRAWVLACFSCVAGHDTRPGPERPAHGSATNHA